MHSAVATRTRLALALLIAGALWALCYLVNPAAVRLLPACPLHRLTGLHCPGCGTTRALYQLAHGQLAAAVGLNALVILSLPVLLYFAFRQRPLVYRPGWTWALVITVVAFGVLRNVPTYPFACLAP